MPTFNFSSYYLNPALSDVTIKIVTDDGLQEELPGHGIVLANVSMLWKQQIDEGSAITLRVAQDPLQVAGSRALVKYVYQGTLPSTSQQALLVHVLHLAHRFAVHSCRSACVDALMALDQQHLQLGAIHVVFSLLAPAAYHGFAPLIQHCLDRLQQQLGDLEVTLSDQQLLPCLQQLPHPALLALLNDERTSAASENTVLAAVQSWLGAQPTDAPVDAQQRQQLASAVRVPYLEPTYLATVLPRIPWLLEILGPEGLALAAGAARGMFDPHAEPCLSNPRACGGLAAGWLKGPRPLPASCTNTQHDGTSTSIEWTVPLAQVKQLFEAACAAATATAARQKAAAMATEAAAARQEAAVTTTAATGQQGWSTNSAAVAVSAAAAAAMNLGASIFRKRKSEHGADSTAPSELVDTQTGKDGQEQHSGRKQRRGMAGRTAAASPWAGEAGSGAAGGGQVGTTATGQGAQAAAGTNVQLRLEEQQHPNHPQQLKLYSNEVQFAGYTWRLVLYFQQAVKLQPSWQDTRLGCTAAGEAEGRVPGGIDQATRAAAIAVAPGLYSQPQQQQQQPQGRAGSMPWGAGHAVDYLGCLQTPGGSQRARRAGTAGLGATARLAPLLLDYAHAAAATPGRAGPANQAVAAAAALGLPDDASPTAPGAAGPSGRRDAAPGSDAATAAAAAADGEANSFLWHCRLAFEAWPCIVLQPGVSTVAFSGSLAVQLGSSCSDAAGAAVEEQTGGQGASGPAAAAGATAGRTAGQRRQRQSHRMGAAGPAPGRVLAARAARSSSTAIAEEPGVSRTPGSRRAAAVAAAARIAAAHDTVPDSDAEDDSGDDVQLVEEGEDVDVQAPAVGAAVRGRSKMAAAAAAGRDHTRGSSGSNGRHSVTEGSEAADEGEDGEEAIDGCGETAAAAAAAGAAAADDAGGSWLVFQLPQASWVKSRRCDTGFRDFFSIQMQQGQWNEAAWARYLQPGGVVCLRGSIWNVR